MMWLIGGIINGGLTSTKFKDFVRYHVNIPDWSIAYLCTKRITTVYYATEVLNNKLPAYISFDLFYNNNNVLSLWYYVGIF